VAWASLAAVVAASALIAGAFAFVQEGDWTRGLNAAYGLRDRRPLTDERIAHGRALYRERCVACHGERGRGDGAAGVGLDPRPADLVLHVPQHTEGELFYMISRGMPGSAMPAWRDVLGERDRWDLVRYLFVLGEGRP
jgi:mono/diheme cytochrome c family protein